MVYRVKNALKQPPYWVIRVEFSTVLKDHISALVQFPNPFRKPRDCLQQRQVSHLKQNVFAVKVRRYNAFTFVGFRRANVQCHVSGVVRELAGHLLLRLLCALAVHVEIVLLVRFAP